MEGDALEVAIALWRSPTMRQALRQRPLPGDVGEVIELAAGAPGPLAAAAARTGERPEQLLEAVRFYLREVLLFSGADAYRVLGVSSQAGAAQIKAHHRALQHWLHPDRQGSNWEAVYATRINAAWSELRSTQRRIAYDARRLQEPGPFDTNGSAPHQAIARWRMVPHQQARWPAWIALAVLLVGGVWLFVLLDRQASAPAPEWPLPIVDHHGAARPTPSPLLPLAVEPAPGIAKEVAGTAGDAFLTPTVPPAEDNAPVESYRSVDTGIARQTIPGTRLSHDQSPAPVRQQPERLTTLAADTPMTNAATRVHMSVRDAPGNPPQAAAIEPPSAPASITAGRAVPPDESAPMPSVDPRRLDLAKRQARELAHYLTSRSPQVPPIWRSAAAQDAAALIRERLENRQARLGDPAWRIAPEHATMTAVIVTPDDASGAATLRVDMDWREGMWLVAAIQADSLP